LPAAPPRAADPPSVVICAARGRLRLNVAELWAARELLSFLVWRDVKVRYKQTVLGASWAIIQPFMTMVVFSIFFGRLAHVPSDGVPYPLFAYAALVPWAYFAAALGGGANSLVANHNLIAKVYFPRLLIRLASVLTPLVDMAIAFALLVLLLLIYGATPTAAVVWLPAFTALTLLTALAMSLWLSALNVAYRDVRYVIPFLVQVWLVATPVAYPASLVPAHWRPLYGLNPMAGVIEGFRWALLGTPAPGAMIAVSCAMVAFLLVAGLLYFRRVEARFADVI
jgi:lipopolysaccharide transport system permease protein